jgi:actin related protein 2/3 complex subunit 1A/1B
LHLVGGKWIEKHVLSEHDMAVTSIDWAPKTNRIVTCSRDKNAYVWTYENNKWNACLVLAKLTFAAYASLIIYLKKSKIVISN